MCDLAKEPISLHIDSKFFVSQYIWVLLILWETNNNSFKEGIQHNIIQYKTGTILKYFNLDFSKIYYLPLLPKYLGIG